MKYALIGCGRIATNHIKAACNNALEIVAVCDIEFPNMEKLLTHHKMNDDSGISRYTDYKKLLDEHPELELVSIATSSGSHAEIALSCIRRGINVIVEKPVAMSMEDADEIIRLAKECKVKVAVCHQNRFNIAVQKLRKAVEGQRFGRISHGTIHVRWNRNREYYEQASWRGTWKEDGGCLMNQCIHGIDLLRWMLGDEAVEVYGVTRQQYHDFLEVEDVGLAIIKFKSGAIGTIEGTVNIYPKNLEETLCLFGESGTVKLGGTSTNTIDTWKFADSEYDDENTQGLKEETSNVYGNGHTNLFADMIEAIREGREPYVDAIAGRNALEVVLAIYKSQKTGRSVKLPLTEFSSTDMIGSFQ